MSLLESRTVRAAITVGQPFATTRLIDVATGQMIETVRGNYTRFEFGFFDAAGTALDLSEIQSLNLKLQPSQTEDGVLADQTLTVLDNTLTAGTWADGTKQHAVFEFTNAAMNIDPAGTVRQLWLVLTGLTTTGREITPIGSSMLLHEDNNGSLATPPENPGSYLTVDQGDARYPRSITRTLAQGYPVDEGWPEEFHIDLSDIVTDTAGNADFQILTELDETFTLALSAGDNTPSVIGPKIVAALNAAPAFAAVHIASMVGDLLSIKYKTNDAGGLGGYFTLSPSAVSGCTFDGGPYTWTLSPAFSASGIIAGQTVADSLGQKCLVGDRPGPYQVFVAVSINPTVWHFVPEEQDIAGAIAATDAKAVPIDADELPLLNSAAAGILARVTFAALWTWVKAKIDLGQTWAGVHAFSSTTRPTSSGTGTPAAASLITRADADDRYRATAHSVLIVLGADEAGDTNTVTLKSSPTLTIPLEVGTWAIEALIVINAGASFAAAGSRQKLHFTGSGTFTGSYYSLDNGSAAGSGWPATRQSGAVNLEHLASGASTSTLRLGTLVVTTPGDLVVQYAQRTAVAAANPTLSIPSYLKALKQ